MPQRIDIIRHHIKKNTNARKRVWSVPDQLFLCLIYFHLSLTFVLISTKLPFVWADHSSILYCLYYNFGGIPLNYNSILWPFSCLTFSWFVLSPLCALMWLLSFSVYLSPSSLLSTAHLSHSSSQPLKSTSCSLKGCFTGLLFRTKPLSPSILLTIPQQNL